MSLLVEQGVRRVEGTATGVLRVTPFTFTSIPLPTFFFKVLLLGFFNFLFYFLILFILRLL